MEKTYTQCQSCGMPMKMDKNGGGTEKDGSKSKMYCSSCYENGEFKNPNITLEEMKKLVDNILKNEMKWLKPLRWFAVRQIPKLERWKRS
jgi:arginine decarboxylase-like protein